MQNLSKHHNKTVVRTYNVSGNGKEEVDQAGGLAKIAVCQKAGAGGVFINSSEMVDLLQEKCRDYNSPKYFFKEIDCSLLDNVHASKKTFIFSNN